MFTGGGKRYEKINFNFNYHSDDGDFSMGRRSYFDTNYSGS